MLLAKGLAESIVVKQSSPQSPHPMPQPLGPNPQPGDVQNTYVAIGLELAGY